MFLCLAAALSWTVWLWPTPQGSVYVIVLGHRVDWKITNLKLVIGNCLPGIVAVIWVRFQGRRQLQEMLSSLVAWRVQSRWYILAVALPLGVFVAALCAVLIFFPTKFTRPPGSILLMSLLTLPFGPLWEEIAWRAFALRRLQTRYSQLVSALILGGYWAVWHIPLWAETLDYLTYPLLLVICLNVVAWSIVFAFLYDRSGQSLPVVILLHSALNTVQLLVFASVGNIHLIPVSALLSMFLAAIIARRWLGNISYDRPREITN